MQDLSSTDGLELSADTHVHLVGIGGSGMSSLAHVLLQRGSTVSGSDLRGGAATDRLIEAGARVGIGHDAAHMAGADLVVISNAVPADNPERVAAVRDGIPVILRADMLELAMAGRRRVLVSGTHGKTTTTSMITVALSAAGVDPSFAIGGALPGGVSAADGTGDVFVAEADEAFRSFLRLTPDVAVITNLEMDHHDEYADLDAYTEAFVEFLGRRVAAGPAILCADDPGTAALAARVGAPVLTYGTTVQADAVITDVQVGGGGSTFTVTADVLGGSVQLGVGVPGPHNVLNATAALLAANAVGADLSAVAEALRGFTGALRRFTRVGTADGVRVIDDYAHHPTEVSATVTAGHQDNPDGRVIALFQPHRYTRTEALGHDLGRALADADLVVVTEVYAAGEAPIAGVSGATVRDGVSARAEEMAPDDRPAIHLVDGVDDAVVLLAAEARSGDLVLTIGAGDVTAAGPGLLELLGARGAGEPS